VRGIKLKVDKRRGAWGSVRGKRGPSHGIGDESSFASGLSAILLEEWKGKGEELQSTSIHFPKKRRGEEHRRNAPSYTNLKAEKRRGFRGD